MNEQTEVNSDYTGTYSPEDNKLRLYAAYRLDSDLYTEVKEAGFRWAPKQDLFYAYWSPKSEDMLLKLAGEIGDEDTSLAERAEQRADRFDGYQENRLKDANQAHDQAKELADGIPFGQPILIGHHSEKRARKQAEQIERGFKKAINMWNTAEYWQSRAKGVISSAKYKEGPEVRARRIKKIEAETRKYQRYIDDAELLVKLWSSDKLNHEKAVTICNYKDHLSACFTLDKFPRNPPASQYEGSMSLWSAMDSGVITWEQARDISLRSKPGTIAYYTRLVNHNVNRLTYEKAMLEDQGTSDLLKPKVRPKQPPMLNYRMPEGILIENRYTRGKFDYYDQYEMTKTQYSKLYKDYKGTSRVNGHRVRVAMNSCIEGATGSSYGMSCIFLTDSKVHAKPEEVK